MGDCNWNSALLASASALTFNCGRDNLKKVFHVSFPNVLCLLGLLLISTRTSSIMTERNSKQSIFCDFSHFTTIIWPCGCDNLKSLSCILFKFVMHVANKQFSDKFNNCWNNSKWPIYCDFAHFTSIIWPCVLDNLKNFTCIIFKFLMHVTNKQFSDKFNNGWKRFKMADILRFFAFHVNILTLWAR